MGETSSAYRVAFKRNHSQCDGFGFLLFAVSIESILQRIQSIENLLPLFLRRLCLTHTGKIMLNFLKNAFSDSPAQSSTKNRQKQEQARQQQQQQQQQHAMSPPPAPVGLTSIAPELAEMTAEWTAIQRFFDAAMSVDDIAERALSAQLSDLAAKLRHMVTLVYCGGSLPASVPPGTPWNKLPASVAQAARKSNGGATAVLRCVNQAYGIFALVCQHAKLNMPRGSRSVLAAFMVDLIRMCETITAASLLAASSCSSSGSSSSNSRKRDQAAKAAAAAAAPDVGHVLAEQTAAVCEPLINFLAKTVHDVMKARQSIDSVEQRQEKLHFARLIGILCEAVAYQGDRLLENQQDHIILMHKRPGDDDETATNASGSLSPSSKSQQQHHHHADIGAMVAESGRLTLPWLLDVVNLFSRADDLHPVSTQALEVILRGHLTLAISPLELQQQESARVAAQMDTIISQLGLTFVTLCRFEENPDFGDQREVCLITMRYFDSLCMFAPHIAEAAEVHRRFYRFLLNTVVVMVGLPSDRTFIVTMLLLAQMMEACAPAGSQFPSLIAQAVMMQPPTSNGDAAGAPKKQSAADSFFARLNDISGTVRSSATNFLLTAVRCCPALFLALLGGSNINSNDDRADRDGDEETGGATVAAADGDEKEEVLTADQVCEMLFPAVSRGAALCKAPAVAAKQMEIARARLLVGESRKSELQQAPSPANFPEFESRRAAFEKQLRRALVHDMQQYTTHESTHCALLTGIFCELLSIPDFKGSRATSGKIFDFLLAAPPAATAASAVSSRKKMRGGLLFDVLPSLAQHTETRLQRLSSPASLSEPAAESDKEEKAGGNAARTETLIENIMGSATTAEEALSRIQKQVSDELRPFARGTVHLAMLYADLLAVLRARDESALLKSLTL